MLLHILYHNAGWVNVYEAGLGSCHILFCGGAFCRAVYQQGVYKSNDMHWLYDSILLFVFSLARNCGGFCYIGNEVFYITKKESDNYPTLRDLLYEISNHKRRLSTFNLTRS